MKFQLTILLVIFLVPSVVTGDNDRASTFQQKQSSDPAASFPQQWKQFPIRSRQDYMQGYTGGEGLQHCQGIARSRSNPDDIYLSHDCGRVWRSRDAGHSWQNALGKGLWLHAGQSIEVDPVDPETILIIADNGYDYQNTELKGLYKSTDGGENFIFIKHFPTHNSRRYEHNIAWDPASVTFEKAIRWYAVSYEIIENTRDTPRYRRSLPVTVWRSENGGDTFEKVSEIARANTLEEIRANGIWCDPHDGRTVWLATNGGLKKSSDRGANWVDVTNGFPVPYGPVTTIAIDEINSDNIYAVAKTWGSGSLNFHPYQNHHGHLYKSTDSGDNWSLLWDDYFLDSVFMSANHPETLYVMASSGIGARGKGKSYIFATHDAGKNWIGPSRVIPRPGLNRGEAWHSHLYAEGGLGGAAPNSENPLESVLFAKGRIWRTKDGGKTYEDSSNLFTGYTLSQNDGMLFDPRDQDRIAIAVADESFFISTNRGRWFSAPDGQLDIEVDFYGQKIIDWRTCVTGSFKPYAGSDDLVLACGSVLSQRALFSDDLGASFSTSAMSPAEIRHYETGWATANTAYGGQWIYSADGRKATEINFGPWDDLNPTLLGACRADSDVFYAFVQKDTNIIRSEDSGTTWHEYYKPGWALARFDSKITFDIDPENCDLIYFTDARGDLGKYDGKIFRSLGVLNLIPDDEVWNHVRAVKVDPVHPEVVYAVMKSSGTSNMFRSTDHGESWTDISCNLPRLGQSGISISPFSGEVVTGGCNGIWIFPPPNGFDYASRPYLGK